jgi:hypothetical protein
MCKLEPAFVAVPSPLEATLTLEGLSKGVEYLEENLVRKARDCRSRRRSVLIGVILTFKKIFEVIGNT